MSCLVEIGIVKKPIMTKERAKSATKRKIPKRKRKKVKLEVVLPKNIPSFRFKGLFISPIKPISAANYFKINSVKVYSLKEIKT